MNSKLRQEWENHNETTKLVNRYKKEHRIRESQTEVDNGVHPLHWATSLGPSPMGTDPINLLKWYKRFWTLQINFSSMHRSLQDLLSESYKTGLQQTK